MRNASAQNGPSSGEVSEETSFSVLLIADGSFDLLQIKPTARLKLAVSCTAPAGSCLARSCCTWLLSGTKIDPGSASIVRLWEDWPVNKPGPDDAKCWSGKWRQVAGHLVYQLLCLLRAALVQGVDTT